MRKVTVRKIWVLAFLLTGFIAGCGREQTSVLVPAVIGTVPANGATVVPVAQAITATFNKAMNATTINTSTFTVTGPGGAPVTGGVACAGTTATFTPATHLAGSTLYTATITTGAKDLLGDALASNFVWSFTTGKIPTVISTNPLNGAINVFINQKITVTFSEAINSATVIAPGTFTVAVAGGGGGAGAGVGGNVFGAKTAAVVPPPNLLPSTQ